MTTFVENKYLSNAVYIHIKHKNFDIDETVKNFHCLTFLASFNVLLLGMSQEQRHAVIFFYISKCEKFLHIFRENIYYKTEKNKGNV